MSAIKLLNNLFFLETLLGIYRAYCSQKKETKYFIIFKIFLQILCYSIAFTVKLYFLFGRDTVLDQVGVIYGAFSASAYINSLSSVVTSICYSREFMSYYRSISRLSDWFKNDIKLIKSLKKLYWCTIIFTLLCIAFVIFRCLGVTKKFPHMNIFQISLIFGVETVIRFTVVYQQIILFVVIMIVVYLFKSFNSFIAAVQERIASCYMSSDEQCNITSGQIQEWVELYQELANSCEKIAISFGRQYFFSLLLSLPNYILTIYQICYQVDLYVSTFFGFQVAQEIIMSFKKGLYTDELKKVIIAILTYALVMFLPFVAGQVACNQGRKLHRVLARLYNTMIVIDFNEAEVKLIKDFIRLVKKKPVDIKFLSKIPAGMYMLPVIFTMAINYVIVLLQFNHII